MAARWSHTSTITLFPLHSLLSAESQGRHVHKKVFVPIRIIHQPLPSLEYRFEFAGDVQPGRQTSTLTMSPSVALLSTALSLGAAWLYLSPSWRQGQRGTINLLMTAVAVLYALLVLSNLMFHWPPNLFRRLGIPINAPVDRIRSLLMREAGLDAVGERMGGAVVVPPEIPKDVETLLTRLGVHGSRDVYVRCVRLSLP